MMIDYFNRDDEEAQTILDEALESGQQFQNEYDNCRKLLEELIDAKNNMSIKKHALDEESYLQYLNEYMISFNKAEQFLKDYFHQ